MRENVPFSTFLEYCISFFLLDFLILILSIFFLKSEWEKTDWPFPPESIQRSWIFDETPKREGKR